MTVPKIWTLTGSTCIICAEPAVAALDVHDDDNQIVMAVCANHDLDMGRVRVVRITEEES